MTVTDLAATDGMTVPPRLRGAWEALASDAIQIVSTDVFDTLLWRRVTDPVDAFPLIGRRLRERGLLEDTLDDATFGQLRRIAEEEARRLRIQRHGQSEVRLSEIYARLPAWVIGSPQARAAAVEVEVEVEAELVVPDLDVCALLRVAVEHGKTLVACSDTYFAPAHLQRLFAQPGFGGVEFRRIFSSSDVRRNKADGLLELMSAAMGVPGAAILHIGDHEIADVEMARRANMTAVHVERRDPVLADVLERERRWHVSADPGRVVPDLGPTGLSAVRAKVVHRADRDTVAPGLRRFWDAGAQVYGPVFAGFAEWTVRWAAERGRPRALCLMREGRFLGELIQREANVQGVTLSTVPMFLNRSLLQRAAIFEGTEEELLPLLGGRTPLSLGRALRRLGLEPADIAAHASDASSTLDDRLLRENVLDRLTEDGPLRAAVIARSRQVRERVLGYLRRTVSDADGPLLLVDVGWGGSIQALLTRLLDQAGMPRAIEGLYLVTHEYAARLVTDASMMRGWLCDFGVPVTATAAIMRSPEVIEQVCMPDHGTQLELDANLEPVLEDIPATLQQLEADVVRQGIRAFQHEWHRYTVELPDKLAPLADRADALRAILARSVAEPTAAEALVFGQWSHDENAGSTRADTIAPTTLSGLRHLTPRQLRDTPMNELYWPAGVATAMDPALARLMGLAQLGEIDWKLLETDIEGGTATLEVSDGDVVLEDSVKQQLRRNRHGLTLLRATFRASVIRELTIRLAETPCAARIDWLEIRAWTRATPEPVVHRIPAEAIAEELHIENAYVERPNLMICRNHFPTVRVPVAAHVRGTVHRVDLEIGMLFVPLSVGVPGRQRFASMTQAEEAYAHLERHVRSLRDPRYIAGKAARRLVRVLRDG